MSRNPIKFDEDGLPIPVKEQQAVSFDSDGLPVPIKKKDTTNLNNGGAPTFSPTQSSSKAPSLFGNFPKKSDTEQPKTVNDYLPPINSMKQPAIKDETRLPNPRVGETLGKEQERRIKEVENKAAKEQGVIDEMKSNVPKSLGGTLEKERTITNGRGAYVYNKLLDGLESLGAGSMDLILKGAMADARMKGMVGIGDKTFEQIASEWNDFKEESRGTVKNMAGAEIPEQKDKKYSKEFFTQVVGSLAETGVAMAGGYPTLTISAYDNGLKLINSTEAGKNLPESEKTIFALGTGMATALLDKYSLDKIFGKQSSKVATNLAMKTMTDLVRTSKTPVTTEMFEQALNESVKGLKQQLLSKGKKVATASGVESFTEGFQEGATILAEELTNKAKGKKIFDNTSWGNRVKDAVVMGAAGGGILGGIASLGDKTRNYIAEKVSEAKSAEDIEALKAEVVQQAESGNATPEEIKSMVDLVGKYAEVNLRIPQDANNRKEVADKIIEREEVEHKIAEKKAELESTDPAFHPEIESELTLLHERLGEINNEAVTEAQSPQKNDTYLINGNRVSEEVFLSNLESKRPVDYEYNGEDATIIQKLKDVGGKSETTTTEVTEPLQQNEPTTQEQGTETTIPESVETTGQGNAEATTPVSVKEETSTVSDVSSGVGDVEATAKKIVGESAFDKLKKEGYTIEKGKFDSDAYASFFGLHTGVQADEFANAGLRLVKPSEKIKVYRGKGKNVSEGENEGVTWVAEDKKVAENYSNDGNVEEIEVTKPKNPFPNPTDTIHVKGSDVGNKLKGILNRLFREGKVTKEQAIEASKAIDEFVLAAGEESELYSTKTNKKGVSSKYVKALQALGFDGIVQKESYNSGSPFTATKTGNETNTYGIFKAVEQSISKPKPTNEAKAIEVQQPTEVESTTIKETNKVGEGAEETVEEKTYTKNALDRADAKKIYAQVREVDVPQDAAQIALEYIANGGKVSEEAINQVAGSVKRASLNTGRKEKRSAEYNLRDYASKTNETLDALAHRLWEDNDQRVSEMDIKDALMDAIGSHSTRLDAGKTYLERYSAEYQENKLQEKFYQEHLEEIAAEEKAINEWLNSEDELLIDAMADEKFVTNLIEKYESETKGEDKQSSTKTESSTNKGTGSETSTQKTEAGEPPIVPPVPPITNTERGNEGELKDKGILASMYKSVPESAKGKVEAVGLKYRVQSQAEAKAIATQIVEDNGVDVALEYASNAKLDGDVRSMIYNVSLNKLAQMEVAETDVTKKSEIANKYSDALIEYDETGRDAGRFNSAIFDFYKSPLGMEFYTNKKREKAFKEKQAEYGKSWDDFYEQYKDEPEFAAMVQAEILNEKMKKPGFAKKAADSLRKKADDILKNGITPDWLKADVKDAKTKGIDRKVVDKAIAKALKIIADAIEVGGNIASVVAEQVKRIKDLGVSAKDSEIAKWLYKESGATGMDAKTFEEKVKQKIESLEKTIKDLEEKVKNNDTSIKKKEVISNDDIVALEAKVKELRAELETLRKEAKVGKYSDESKVAAAEKAAQKNIGELEEKIANNDLEFDKIDKPTSPQLEAYREKQKALRKELEEKRKEAKVGKYSDESRIRAIEDRIKDYERKISEKDYASKPKEEYTGKLKDAKEQLNDAKKAYYEARKDFPAYKQKVSERYLQRMKKKLDGLNERQRRKVVEESFRKLAENGALSQEEFREIIGNTLGLGKLTPEQATKLRGYVEDINAVDDARMEYVETDGSESSKKKLAQAEKKSLESKSELGNVVYTESNVWDTIRAAMQLTAIGVPTIMKNFAWNFVAQGLIKFPANAVVSLGDAAIAKAANILNLPYSRTTSFMGKEQGAFFRHLREGVIEGSRAVRYGINSKDYFEKGVSTKPIQPIKSGVEFLDWAKGNSDLTFAQGMDKLIKASWVGYYMEGVARGLTFFDKPLRYAAEGGTASRIAKKELGLSDAQAKVFERVPKEFAIKHYMSKGDNLAQATKKAEVIVDRIKEVGDKSVAQQANLLSETINKIGQYAKQKTEESPAGKTLVGAGKVVGAPMALFIKTPANIAWQVFSLINPTVAVAQAGIFSANAYKKYKKGDVTYMRDLDRAKDWMGTAVVGIGMGMLGQFLTGIGVVESGEDEDTKKKERDATKQYSKKFTFNYSKFNRYIQGIPDSKNDEDIRIDLSWFGQVGAMMDMKQRMAELSKDNPDLSTTDKLTEELSQSAKIAISSSVLNSASALSTAFSSYDGFKGFGVNYINTMANIVQPQAFAQDSRAGIDYEYQVKADGFLKQLDNTFTARSSLYRYLTDKYPPSDIGIWGDKIDKGGSKYLRYFGISKDKKNPFAQEIYNDAERTGSLDFLPPSVKNKITKNGESIKLNTEQERYLEEQVGKERKRLVTAYVSGAATIVGYGKYSDIKDDKDKKDALEVIYRQGFNFGKYKFFQKYSQLNHEKTEQEKESDKEESQKRKDLNQDIKSNNPQFY